MCVFVSFSSLFIISFAVSGQHLLLNCIDPEHQTTKRMKEEQKIINFYLFDLYFDYPLSMYFLCVFFFCFNTNVLFDWISFAVWLRRAAFQPSYHFGLAVCAASAGESVGRVWFVDYLDFFLKTSLALSLSFSLPLDNFTFFCALFFSCSVFFE